MTAEQDCGYEQQAQAVAERKVPPYRVTCAKVGVRYKIEKADGTVYYVSYGTAAMHCTCPDARHRRQGACKHCRFVANLIGRPELVK